MRKILIALAMLFVIFLNVRALFGEHPHDDINTEIDVYGTWAAIKDYLYTVAVTDTTTGTIARVELPQETRFHDVMPTDTLCKEAQTIASNEDIADKADNVTSAVVATNDDEIEHKCMRYGASRFYQQQFDRVMDDFRRSGAWNEMGIQQIINLLKHEMTIVDLLLSACGYELETAVNKRNQTVAESSPTTVHVYDATMDLATYHPKLEQKSYKNKQDEIIMFSGSLNRREKRLYLHNINKILRAVVHDLSAAQVS